MNEKKYDLDDTFLIEYLENTKYGKLAHFFSMNDGNYFTRIIENQNSIIYDRLSNEEEQELLSTLDINEYQ